MLIKTGISLAELKNKSPQELFGAEQGEIVRENYKKCVLAGKSITYEEELNLPAGHRIWLTSLTPIIKEDVITHIVGSAKDITARKKLELQLAKQANYDNLTGLPNRKLFFEVLEQIIEVKERDKQKFALLFLDLDGFKDINDNYGHEAGDQVLITAGKRLVNCVRKSDTVARMGGDEFTIILRNIKNKKNAVNIVQKIHKVLSEVMKIGIDEYSIDSSIGGAIYPDHGTDSESLLRKADLTMYEVKKAGKGDFKFFSSNS